MIMKSVTKSGVCQFVLFDIVSFNLMWYSNGVPRYQNIMIVGLSTEYRVC